MNKNDKYQEAINELYKQRSERYKVHHKHKDWNKEIIEYDKVGYSLSILQELVDKVTPKKPMKIKTDYMETYVCPNCRHSFEGFSYCRYCGQRLQRFEVESEDE